MRLPFQVHHLRYRRHAWAALYSPVLHTTSTSSAIGHSRLVWQQQAALNSTEAGAAAQDISRSLPTSLLHALAGRWFTADKVAGAGRGLIAVRDIPQGQEVLREQPMLAVPATSYMHMPSGSTHRARSGQVCYHCLGSLQSASAQHPLSGQAFCSTECMEEACMLYHEVEAHTQLQPLVQSCAQSGTRMPLMVARLACQHITSHARSLARHMSSGMQNAAASSSMLAAQACKPQQTRTPEGSAAMSASRPVRTIQGDALCDMSFLCHANVCKPYPEPWAQEWQLLSSGLQPAVAWLAEQLLAGIGIQQPAAAAADSSQHKQEHSELHSVASTQHTPTSAQVHTDDVQQQLLQGLCLDWYVSVLSRLHVNTFRVDGIVLPPVMGTQAPNVWASDLASQAAALLLAAEGGMGVPVEQAASNNEAVSETGGGGGLGSALYLTASLLNHSCEPNLHVVFPRNNATVALRAARDIQAGEQLHISYLDNTLPFAARQRQLHFGYGFVCRCSLCSEQQSGTSHYM